MWQVRQLVRLRLRACPITVFGDTRLAGSCAQSSRRGRTSAPARRSRSRSAFRPRCRRGAARADARARSAARPWLAPHARSRGGRAFVRAARRGRQLRGDRETLPRPQGHAGGDLAKGHERGPYSGARALRAGGDEWGGEDRGGRTRVANHRGARAAAQALAAVSADGEKAERVAKTAEAESAASA